MKKAAHTLLLMLLLQAGLLAQEFRTVKRNFIFFPKEVTSGEVIYYTGISMAQLPTKIVEDIFDQVPMIDLKLRFGLPFNFSATADLSSNIFTTLLKAGSIYSISHDNLSLSVGNDFLFWYGFFNNDDFDISVLGWGYSPSVSIGYDFADFFISLKAEANIKAQNTYMKSLQYTKNSPKFVGTTFSFAVEQPLWKDNILAIGFRAYYTKFFYKSWISFSTFDEYLFYPEFFVGFIF